MRRPTYFLPLVIAVVTTVGLVVALIGDGLGDWLGWLGLAFPSAFCLSAVMRRRDT